jgi:drug/metabolite transporter (DMT)-like permease
MNKRVIAELELLLMTAIWGTTFALVKEAVAIIPPLIFCFGRFTIASLCLMPLVYKKPQFRDRKIWLISLTMGLCLVLGFAFQTVGLRYTTASKSAFITGLAVAFVPLLGKLFFHKRLSYNNLLGLIICIAGLVCLTGIYQSFNSGIINTGDLLTIFAAVVFALQILLVEKYASYDFLVIGCQECIITAFFSLLYAVSFESLQFHLDSKRIFIFIFMGLAATAFTIPLQVKAQRYASAFHSVLIFSLEPVLASLFAFFYTGEIMTSIQIGGGALMIAGVIIGSLDIASRKSSA